MQEGEVVILKEEGIAKSLWPLARVTEVIHGREDFPLMIYWVRAEK